MEKSGRHNNIYVYLEQMAQGLAKEVKELGLALATFSTELKGMRETLAQLSKIVKDGNGQPALITKMAMAEKAIEDLTGQVSEMGDKMETSLVEVTKTDRETRGQRLQFWASVLVGLMGAAATALSLLK